ncbi:LAGLIDADG family homing endonuclease [Microtetraspora sp. NBRC 16547]|uniref:LAGLIDADG family homing endonuclease n=1 Tax=Microtetraspora sp. NBRC 16547 TaxID=3030993 RepID=UPI00255397CB|nr:LAGLIDADG family homing endonuclease [Microtetraspora sp. NBRC 16547]
MTEEHPVLVRTPDGRVNWKKPSDIPFGRRNAHGGIESWNSWACLPKLAEETAELDLLPHLPESFAESPDGGLVCSYESKYRADQQWIHVPRRVSLDYDFGYLLGIYAAEGHLQVNSGKLNGEIGITLSESEDALAQRVCRIFAKYGANVQTYIRDGRGARELRTSSVPLAYVFASVVGMGAKSKRVPTCILNGPADAKNGFLEGFLAGDGRNPGRASNTTGRRDVKVASRSLAWGVRTLLADLGHWVTVSTGIERGNFPQGSTDREYRWFQVAYMPERVYARTLEDNSYLYRPIKSVETVDLDCEVFNFEVEDDNSYVSDFILHNCEAYVAPASRHHKKREDHRDGGHRARHQARYRLTSRTRRATCPR